MEFELSEDNQAAIEKANAYREMMNMWAWKDLMKMIDVAKQEAFDVIDRTSLEQLTPSKIAEAKGIRKAFINIESEINLILGNAGYKTK